MPVYKSVPFVHQSGAQFLVALLPTGEFVTRQSGVIYASSEERLAVLLQTKAVGSSRSLPAGFAPWAERPSSRPASPPPRPSPTPTWTAEAKASGADHARSVRPRSVAQTRHWLGLCAEYAEATASGVMDGNPAKRASAVETSVASYLAACSREGVVPDAALLRRAAVAARLAAAAAAEATSPIEG
jgi:hypothetical protein